MGMALGCLTRSRCAVALALPLDVMRIEDSGLIDPGWRERVPNNGVVAESVVSIVYRKDNPKQIHGWDDLTRYSHVVLSGPGTLPSKHSVTCAKRNISQCCPSSAFIQSLPR